MAMKLPKFLFTVVLIVGIAIVSSATPTIEETRVNTKDHNNPSSTISRFLGLHEFVGHRHRAPMTYERSPRVCWAIGSRGPDCCNKKCVNVMTDKRNCGMCGRKCNYSELCCKGSCVDPSVDEKHCGKCHNRCPAGSLCVYGLCSYA